MTIPGLHIPHENIKTLYKILYIHISLRQESADQDPVLELHKKQLHSHESCLRDKG